jgi:iron complex transport system ATP-binding protein
LTRLELSRVSIAAGKRRLLSELDFEVSSGEFVAVVGPNGAGKTTLLRTALGLLTPVGGTVRVNGEPVQRLDGRARAARLSWLPQQLSTSEPLRAVELVMAARFRFVEPESAAREAALQALARLGAEGLAGARVDRISGGERQRIALAALLAQSAELLLLDEPANHLDPAHQAETYRLLGELWSEGLGLVCVTHDVNLLAHSGDPERLRVVGLRAGQVAFSTRYADPDLGARLSELFDVRMATFHSGSRRFIVPEIPSPGEVRVR